MFGSQILDVGIGLITLFLLLSLVCSSIKEGLETFLKYRSKDLEQGIKEIFNDPSMLPKFYDNPLISGLFKGHYADAKKLGNLPSYIPSQTFALAVLDMLKTEPEDSYLRKTLTPLVHAAEDDSQRAQKNVEDWYNAAMDRVSGWYKRRTQIIIAALGFAIAGVFNIDAFAIARYLNATPGMRSAFVEQAKKSTSSAKPPTIEDLSPLVHATDIPLGWKIQAEKAELKVADWRAVPQLNDPWGWFMKIAGMILTGLCVSLGAPFWFDVLNKFMVIRSTVKPEEKSREEPSKS
jgi:hypothetical protein